MHWIKRKVTFWFKYYIVATVNEAIVMPLGWAICEGYGVKPKYRLMTLAEVKAQPKRK